MPLHRPGSANVAASVCIYRKQERPLRCRPIVWPCPTACLCSPVPAGQSAFVSPRRVPSLCFDVRHHAGDRTFYAPIRPRRRPIVQWRLTQGRGGQAIPRPAIQGPVGHCASPAAPPAVLRRFSRTTAGYVDHPQASGPAGDRPPPSLRRPASNLSLIHI